MGSEVLIPRPGLAGRLGGVALLLLLGKAAYEWLFGAALFADLDAAGAAAVPLAHLLGGMVGAIVALVPATAAARRTGPYPVSPHSGHRAGVATQS